MSFLTASSAPCKLLHEQLQEVYGASFLIAVYLRRAGAAVLLGRSEGVSRFAKKTTRIDTCVFVVILALSSQIV